MPRRTCLSKPEVARPYSRGKRRAPPRAPAPSTAAGASNERFERAASNDPLRTIRAPRTRDFGLCFAATVLGNLVVSPTDRWGLERWVTAVIYVGVDSSGPSRAALAWALDRATSAQLPLTLVHVGDTTAQLAAMGTEKHATEDADFVTTLAERARAHHPSIDISTRFLRGSIPFELSTMPKPADLLVLGTHKTGYLRGRSVGTLGMIIANAAVCSVAVIPDNGLTQRHGVVVAIGSTGWELAVAVGVREALRLSDNVILMHAVPPTRRLAGRDATAARNAEAQRLMVDAAAAAHRVAPHITVSTRVSTRPTLDAILDASWSASLLVLGSRVPDAVTGFVGSTTHDVLTNINSPVLIARGEATLT